MATPTPKKHLNRTAQRVIHVLKLLKKSRSPMTLQEISTALNIPPSSAFSIVHTLLDERLIEYEDERSKTFRIGIGSFEIGSIFIQNKSLVKIARPYVEKLMETTKATSFLAIPDNHEIVYIDKVESEQSIHTSAVLGSHRNMWSTGLGKAILAYYSEEKVRSLISGMEMLPYTEYSITDIDLLLENLRETRERGFAIDNRESDINIFCIAHAILDATGTPIAAISCAAMYAMLDDSTIKHYGRIVTQYAMEISKQVGYLEY
ncbi:MAG: IclR family transcriptional regulator [Clostridiales Family XIII bacterium]|jgi:DNA-binding IclR family transcriptional regulator|nr:IclR family transcriptional regulator [Clostridiales Family XIII bacterium]